MSLTAALTYGYDLDGRDVWNIRELDRNEEPRLFWYTGNDFYKEASAVLQAAGVDVEIVRYGDESKGVVGHILAASADVERGPVSRPFASDCINLSPADLAEHDARLAAALTALGITPTDTSWRTSPIPAKPGWITSAYQA